MQGERAALRVRFRCETTGEAWSGPVRSGPAAPRMRSCCCSGTEPEGKCKVYTLSITSRMNTYKRQNHVRESMYLLPINTESILFFHLLQFYLKPSKCKYDTSRFFLHISYLNITLNRNQFEIFKGTFLPKKQLTCRHICQSSHIKAVQHKHDRNIESRCLGHQNTGVSILFCSVLFYPTVEQQWVYWPN